MLARCLLYLLLFSLQSLASPVTVRPRRNDQACQNLASRRLVQHRLLPSIGSAKKRRLGLSGNGIISFLCDQPVLASVCNAVGAVVTPTPAQTVTVETPLGPVIGTVLSEANRFTIRYAQAARFQSPVMTSSWGGQPLNATALPPPCPQDSVGSTSYTDEDCLYINIFAPKNANGASHLPIFTWVHGGSLLFGSSTDPGLDGSTFAFKNNAIVVTLQYRLGILGFLKADSMGIGGNMGVRDLLAALTFTRSIISSFGGDTTRLTLAGQSSGADLIRTLLATPSADGFFQRGIIQSAPANYGDQSPEIGNLVGGVFLQAAGCSSLACLQAMSVPALLAAQDSMVNTAPSANPAVAASIPLRPIVDGSLIRANTFPLVDGQDGGFTNRNRQLLLTTVQAEAAPTIEAISQEAFGGGAIPVPDFVPLVDELLVPASRAKDILQFGLYDPANNSADARDALTLLGTEYVWRCAVQQIALNATATHQAPAIYLAEFDVGITYPANQKDPYCVGKVCHQDDIYATFGNGPAPLTPAQSRMQTEVLARWGAFAATGNPTPAGFAQWPTVGTSPQLLVFSASTGAGVVANSQGVGCKNLWGTKVPFDAQLYGP